MKRKISESQPLIVLGRGFSRDPDGSLLPHPESAHNAMAAGLLLREGRYSSVVFSGGHTLGRKIISEAEIASNYMLDLFPEISSSAIFLEDRSIDTRTNVLELARKGFIHPEYYAPLVTVQLQIQRAADLFRNISDVETLLLPSETIIELYGPDTLKETARSYIGSSEYNKTKFKEPILALLANTIDRKGKKLHWYTSLKRHGNEV